MATTHQVTARIVLMVTSDVPGKTLQEALENTKALKEQDFIKFKPGVDFSDGSFEIVSVTNNHWVE